MAGEIVFEEKREEGVPEEEPRPLRNLEERLYTLLNKYQELKKERDELAVALDTEKEKMIQLEKRLELLSQDREKVKTRLDQLLYRLKSVEI